MRLIGVPVKWDTRGKKFMSYFSTALKRIAERNELKQADIVRESGLTRSHVSRLFTGDQKAVYDTDMAAILRVFRQNPRDRSPQNSVLRPERQLAKNIICFPGDATAP